MNSIHFRNLDLNLFRVLLALLDLKSVTAAATELSLTPSAVSHALNRLRTALGDPLFERRGGALAPTAFALEVGRRARPALEQLSRSIDQPAFDPQVTDRQFVIAGSSYAAFVLMPAIIERVGVEAPFARLVFRRMDTRYIEDLERGAIDVAIGVDIDSHRRIAWRPLCDDDLVWAARVGHPFVHAPLTMDMLARADHVVIERMAAFVGEDYPEVQGFLDDTEGLRNAYDAARVGARQFGRPVSIVQDIAHALAFVRGSDAVTLSMRRIAESAGMGLQVLEPPHARPVVSIGVLFLQDRAREPALAWLVDQVTAASRRD